MIKTCNNCACDKVCDHNIYNFENCGNHIPRWTSVKERTPSMFVSVLGYMPDAEPFPAIRECYRVGKEFYFPALNEVHPVSYWRPMPEAPKEIEQ